MVKSILISDSTFKFDFHPQFQDPKSSQTVRDQICFADSFVFTFLFYEGILGLGFRHTYVDILSLSLSIHT